jgi:two-component system sensor histidine kinase/response regulator
MGVEVARRGNDGATYLPSEGPLVVPDDIELYRKLVDASTGGVWLLDGDGNTLLFNPRMAELLGRTPEEMAVLNAYDVHDEQGRREFAAHLERVRGGDPGHDDMETMYLRPDGTPVWLLCSWRPILHDDGSPLGYLHQYSGYDDLRRLIQTLADREQQLATAQRIARIGSWEWDVVSDRTHWSDELFRIYGISREDFRGDYEAFLDFIHPDDRDAVREAVAATYDGADEFSWQARVVRGDGGVRWCRGLGRVERGADGQPVRMMGTDQDITDQVTAEHELAEASRRLSLLRDVAEVANKSTVLTEALILTARVIDTTPGWHIAWAIAHDETGATATFPLSYDQALGHVVVDEDLVEKAFRNGEVTTAPLSGRELTHTLVAIPIQHSEDVVSVVLAVGEEVPPDDHSRDLIAQIAAMLGRVAERERTAHELAEARDEAMHASRLKSEFLATMSHEIRTPMNGVIGLTDLLMRTPLDDQQRRLADALHGAGQTLRGIINDILDLSKIEAGKLELELVDFEVRSVVEQTVGLLRGLADEKGLDLRLSVAPRVPTYVRGDAVRFEQVLTNLGSNAVKFTDRGSVQVSVDIAERRPDGHLLEVVVSDTGPGIPEAAQRRLFDAFTQADPSTTRRHGGTGLGLTIVRQLVEALGGEISVHSELGRGSRFRFTAGFGTAVGDARDEQGLPGTRTGVAPPAATHRVLVVEDNQVNQMVAVGLLESVGFATEVAVDGVEAVEALAGDHGFSAVLMDCRMPRMDGYTATRTIRENEPPGRRVPIIAMTASALEGERERCLACGMDDFLTKPVDSDRLHRTLRHWVGEDEPKADPAPGPASRDTLAAGHATPAPAGDLVDGERIDMLHEMVKDGVSLFQRSSGNFIAHAQDHLTAIGSAVADGDAEQLMATAHKLKGSALNLGLPRVGAAAFELEERGRAARLDGAEAAYSTLSREMGLALAALERERAARA